MNTIEIRAANRFAAEDEALDPAAKSLIYRLIDEVRRLRQGLWDVARISGADIEDDTPDHMVYPDIVDYAKQEVGQLRDDYNESLAECTAHDS